jgi:KDO2-lipid IV(A) lauroyltransferase
LTAESGGTDPGTNSPLSEDRQATRRKWQEKERRAAERAVTRRRIAGSLKTVRAIVGRLPMPVACALGHTFGTFAYFISRRARRQALDNLAAALPELSAGERRRIARRSFALAARGAMAFVVAHRLGAERALRRVEPGGVPEARAALADGKGLLIVTFHMGCFELMASLMAREFGGKAVGRETDEDGPTALLIEMRRDLGCDTIQRGEPREILRTLRDGKPVAFLIDQDTDDVNGVFVPFFGRPAHTPIGPAALAVRTGAPVIMGFIHWEGLSRHRTYAACVLHPDKSLPADQQALELTARMTKIGEDEIRKRPDHWVWMHRRWETRPEEHPERPVWRLRKEA